MTMGKKTHLFFIAMNVKKGTLNRIETIEFLMEKKGDKKNIVLTLPKCHIFK